VTSFLDRGIVPQDDRRIVALHDILIRAYDDEYGALALAGQVGLLKADISRYPKLRLTWWSILEEAAKERQLRRLINTALEDPTTANWHAKIRDILGPAELLRPEKETPRASRTEAERRKTSMRPEVGDYADLWDPGTTLRIRFLNGSASLRDAVESAAMQWVEYANLNFEVGDDPDAPIRVSFDRQGSWAYLAKQCLTVNPNEPTANFGWFTEDTPQSEISATVLHEFGHILGLQHEHSNPTSTLKWNRPKIYKTLQGPPNNWTRKTIDRHVFAIWPPKYFPVHKVFDRQSIMMYALPADYFADGKAIDRNMELSPLDKQFAAALYPQRHGGES